MQTVHTDNLYDSNFSLGSYVGVIRRLHISWRGPENISREADTLKEPGGYQTNLRSRV